MSGLFNNLGLEITTGIKLFTLLYGVSFAFMYIIYYATGGRFMLPGDFYKVKAPKRIYLPFGGALIITLLVYVIVISKLIYIVLTVAALYIGYKAVFKRKK